VPTHIIASDPDVCSIFTGALADEVRQNPVVTMSVVTGAGHSPHRDLPEATMQHLEAALR
jgi:pimeloyl-ACP methyl ester carboxylesterase